MVKQQRSVLFVSKGEDSSSTRYRAINYFPLLQQHGWKPFHITDDKTAESHRRILAAAREVDAVVILRRAPGWWYGRRLRKASRLLIFDLDDAIFVPRSGLFSRRPARFRHIVKRCDYVWAGNSYLASAVLRFNNCVSLLPTAIEIERYQPVSDKPHDRIMLVWIGSRSTRKYLTDILPALEQACSGCKAIQLRVIADFALQSDILSIENLSWSQATEAEALATATIGIAPMRDDLWTRGKCGLKVLQYMASGLPVITSPVGVNRDLVEAGVTGLHADSVQQWVDAIHTLAHDPAMILSMGAAGRQKCESGYTLQQTFRTLLGDLEQRESD
jgi:glycosyltransferase involved in cell wall biosynthesis